jgi:hypothetical protein
MRLADCVGSEFVALHLDRLASLYMLLDVRHAHCSMAVLDDVLSVTVVCVLAAENALCTETS